MPSRHLLQSGHFEMNDASRIEGSIYNIKGCAHNAAFDVMVCRKYYDQIFSFLAMQSFDLNRSLDCQVFYKSLSFSYSERTHLSCSIS